MGEGAGDDSSIHFAEHRDSSHFRPSRGTLRSVDGCWLMVDGRENDEGMIEARMTNWCLGVEGSLELGAWRLELGASKTR
jgi:hypothetical protein